MRHHLAPSHIEDNLIDDVYWNGTYNYRKSCKLIMVSGNEAGDNDMSNN